MLDNIEQSLILSEMTIQKIEWKKAKIADWIIYNNTGQYWTIFDNTRQYGRLLGNIGLFYGISGNIGL